MHPTNSPISRPKPEEYTIMKYLIVLVACLALACADLPKMCPILRAQIAAHSILCMARTRASLKIAAEMRDGRFENVKSNEKCFLNCIMEKTGFSANGQIKPDVVKSKFGSSIGAANLKALQAKCDSKRGGNNCETAFLLYKCYHENYTAKKI